MEERIYISLKHLVIDAIVDSYENLSLIGKGSLAHNRTSVWEQLHFHLSFYFQDREGRDQAKFLH